MSAPASGFWGLLQKEVLRFWRVVFQTVGAPVLSTLLWLFVFSHVLGGRTRVLGEEWAGFAFTEFLLPGLVMMSVLQNSFSNSSSSLIQSKITGNLLLVVLPPISSFEFFLAYVGASVIRGLVVGAGVLLAGVVFVPSLAPASLATVLLFAALGGVMAGALGLIAGLWAEKFDQISLFTNFIIMPLTFLSGVFYSIHTLPPFWRDLSQFNPFFYMIDGFRRGFFHRGDVPLEHSLAVTAAVTAAVAAIALHLVRIGYKVRT